MKTLKNSERIPARESVTIGNAAGNHDDRQKCIREDRTTGSAELENIQSGLLCHGFDCLIEFAVASFAYVRFSSLFHIFLDQHNFLG